MLRDLTMAMPLGQQNATFYIQIERRIKALFSDRSKGLGLSERSARENNIHFSPLLLDDTI